MTCQEVWDILRDDMKIEYKNKAKKIDKNKQFPFRGQKGSSRGKRKRG